MTTNLEKLIENGGWRPIEEGVALNHCGVKMIDGEFTHYMPLG